MLVPVTCEIEMILSDHSIREEVAAGRIVIDPFDPTCVQPSSVDLHVDGLCFAVFQQSFAAGD